MAKARLFDLPETKGAFQLKGIVSGMEKDNAFKEITTRSNKPMRIINFGVSYDNNKTLFVNMQGMEQENVYFSKRSEKRGEKGETVKVPWADRFSYNRDGFRLIGKNIGVKKIVDSEGKFVNDKKVLTEFDTCKEVKENLKDGASVFIKGNIGYSSKIDDNGNKKTYTNLVPNQISLCSDIDFDSDNFKKQNDFNQVIVFIGIEKEKNDKDKETGRYTVAAKIITYSTIEDVEFIIEDSKLANMFKKNLNPYNAIKVSGHMTTFTPTETVDDEDVWGESDAIEKVSAQPKREFVITGAKGSSIDKELYSQAKVEEAMAKIAKANKADEDFGGSSNDSDWGNSSDLDDDTDEAW